MPADVCFGVLSAITCPVPLTHVLATSNNLGVIYVRANDTIRLGIAGHLILTRGRRYFFSHKIGAGLSFIFTAILKSVREKIDGSVKRKAIFGFAHERKFRRLTPELGGEGEAMLRKTVVKNIRTHRPHVQVCLTRIS